MTFEKVSPPAESAGRNTDRPIAWVTGAGGLIGHYLIRLAPQYAPGWNVRGLTRANLELTDFAAVREAFHADRPQRVIHCAALSRSPDCAADPRRAHLLNVEVTRCLAELATEISFCFFSTDLVFDGREGHRNETAVPHPLSVYGATKAEAESHVLRNPRHSVIRTSLNGGISPAGNRGFNEELRRAWVAGQSTRLFTDEYRSPVFAGLTARAVWELAHYAPPGLYHVAGAERLSRWEIGQLLACRWPGVQARMESASLRDYEGQPRPPDTSLDCTKAQSHLSFPLLGLRTWLAQHPTAPF